MSPAPFRHTLIWSLPTLAVLLTFLWYKSRRGSSRSDPGGTAKGTRKTNKQKEISNIDSSFLYNNCKVQVSEIDSATSREETRSKENLPVVIKDIVEPSVAEKQESEHQISLSYTNNNCVKEESLVESDARECVDKKLVKVKENIHNISNHNYNSSHIEDDISCNTKSGVIVPPKTSTISVSEESPIIVSSSSNFERICSTAISLETKVPLKVKSNILDSTEVSSEAVAACNNTCEVSILSEITPECIEPQVTSTQSFPLQETNPQVTDCIKENIHKDNSELHTLNELSTEASALTSQFTVFSEVCSETFASSKVNSEGAVSSEAIFESNVPGEVISDVGVSTAVDTGSTNLNVYEHCVTDSNSEYTVDEERNPVVEFCTVKESSSNNIDIVCDNTSNCYSEEETMPESVTDACNLKTTTNSDLVTKTKSEEMKPVSVEVSESSLREELDSTQTDNMHSNILEEALGDGNVAAANGDCGLDGKLAALDLGKSRDSANHSPAEVMLASPSVSSYSDEGSSDSGKGCSDLATPPSRTPASGSSVSGDATALSVYEFVLPQHYVGRLIGRHGAFVHQIKAKTNANILIKRHPDTSKLKICAVEGTQLDIDSALEMIRKKFPLKLYPTVTLEQVCFVPPVPVYPVLSECLQLMLVEGVSNDVILSSLVTPSHFFLQQPTHPTYPALSRLNVCMNMCYSAPNAPLLPTPINPGVICAAPTMGGWFRAQVVSVDNENSTCEVKFVDYGGYLSLEHSALRQIRSDFMTLPFQASECFLANVVPAGGEEASWSPDAAATVEELTRGQVLQAQVSDYSEENIPNVFLFAVHCNQMVLVNQELVSRGFAEWLTVEEINDAASS